MSAPFWRRGAGGGKQGFQSIFQRIFDKFSGAIQVRISESFPAFFKPVGDIKEPAYPTFYDAVDPATQAVKSIPYLATASVVTGTENLTTVAAGRTITRAAGDWVADGAQIGDMIRITSGLTGINLGNFSIAGVATGVLTLEDWETLTDEGPVSSNWEIVRGVTPATAPNALNLPTMVGTIYSPGVSFLLRSTDVMGSLDFEVWAQNNDHSWSCLGTVFMSNGQEVYFSHKHRPILIRFVRASHDGTLLIGPS